MRPCRARDSYEIIAGERRWRAAQIAGLHEVPVMVRELTDREALEFGIIENVQREDLSPLEEAEGYQAPARGIRPYPGSPGKNRRQKPPAYHQHAAAFDVARRRAPDDRRRQADLGHARALVPAKNPLALAQEIVRKGLNVRQAETLAKRDQDNPEIHKKRASPRRQCRRHRPGKRTRTRDRAQGQNRHQRQGRDVNPALYRSRSARRYYQEVARRIAFSLPHQRLRK